MVFESLLAKYIWISLIALSPISEARGAVIWGLATGLNHTNVFALSLAINILAIPLVYLIFDKTSLMKFIRKKLGKKIDQKINRNKKRFETYEELALLAFVAIPAPGSGVYTATIVSEILKFNRKKSFVVVAIGALFATTIVYLTTTGVLSLVEWF